MFLLFTLICRITRGIINRKVKKSYDFIFFNDVDLHVIFKRLSKVSS